MIGIAKPRFKQPFQLFFTSLSYEFSPPFLTLCSAKKEKDLLFVYEILESSLEMTSSYRSVYDRISNIYFE